MPQWAVIPNNLALFMSGLYPNDQYWRIWFVLGMILTLVGLSWGILARNVPKLFSTQVLVILGVLGIGFVLFPLTRTQSPVLLGMTVWTVLWAWLGKQFGRKFPESGKYISFSWFLSYTVALWVLTGQLLFGIRPVYFPYTVLILGLAAWIGWYCANTEVLSSLGYWGKVLKFLPAFGLSLAFLAFSTSLLSKQVGLELVSTNDIGGLTLTLLLAVIGIALCFPIGLIMALGRRSDLPIVKGLSVAYIELIRGVPLISILFMGQVMIPLFLPEGVRPDRIDRAIIGLTIFSSAYLAENVRAGLQAIPRGQFEAAASFGYE